MSLPIITESTIRQHSSEQSFERGRGYYSSGAVFDTIRRGSTLKADVEGSSYEPYRVSITFDEGGVRSAICTCPYDWGGYCKHIIAVLLTYVHEPGVFEERPTIGSLLEDLSEEQLRQLIDALLAQNPGLTDWFEVMVGHVSVAGAQSEPGRQKRRTPVDTAAYRRQIKYATGLLDYRNHWESIWDMVAALEAAHAQAQTFLEGGDFDNALALMRVLGEEIAPEYGNLEEECQLAEFLEYQWADDLTEAILGADLSDEERVELDKQLTTWASDLGDYGLDDAMDKPIAACARGWDVLPDDADAEWFVDLTDAQLNVLERQGDDEAYLRLCLERGAHYRYARRLAETGKIEQATQHALDHALTAPEYLALARFLREQKDEVEAAYQVGMRGLTADDSRYNLGEWLAGFAEATKRPMDAMKAWLVAFNDMPSLEAYQNLKRLASEEWEDLRPGLIDRLEKLSYGSVYIEALIDDRAIDEAVQAWARYASHGDYVTLEKLVDAAAATHPDWSAEHALREAYKLIDKRSKYYPHAVRWLGKVKAIYLQHDRPEDWTRCLAGIREEHGRKYSLMGQIKAQLED
jgi:uncharacterized Zn finger protein